MYICDILILNTLIPYFWEENENLWDLDVILWIFIYYVQKLYQLNKMKHVCVQNFYLQIPVQYEQVLKGIWNTYIKFHSNWEKACQHLTNTTMSSFKSSSDQIQFPKANVKSTAILQPNSCCYCCSWYPPHHFLRDHMTVILIYI